jgi:hypothetical protein
MQGQYLKDSRVSKLREAKCRAVGAVREQKIDCRLWQNEIHLYNICKLSFLLIIKTQRLE